MKDKAVVLVAEDEEMHSYPMEIALEEAGFEVRVVRDYDGVIKEGRHADALVIDARLPSEALEGLHAAADLIQDGLKKTIPIIFVSVYAEKDEPVEKKLRGLPNLKDRYDWLEKWFEPSNLVRLITLRLNQAKKNVSPQGTP